MSSEDPVSETAKAVQEVAKTTGKAFDRDRRFRNVTGDFEPNPKSVTIKRNCRSRSNGNVGHVRPEITVTMVRSTQ